MSDTQTAVKFTRADVEELSAAVTRTIQLKQFIAARYRAFLELTGDTENLNALSMRVKDPFTTTTRTNHKNEPVEVYTVTLSWGGDQFGETTTTGYVPVNFVFDEDGAYENALRTARDLISSVTGISDKNRR